MSIDSSTGPSAVQNTSLLVKALAADEQDPVAIVNEGYWGIPVRPQTEYHGSFYAKAAADVGTVSMSLVDDLTGKMVASGISDTLSPEWKQYSVTMRTSVQVKPSSAFHVQLAVHHAGNVWFDVVSLFGPTYKNRANGNRVDLMEMLAAMKPAFLRFPGGNYLEGDHISERFDWKKTIGPIVDRPGHPSPWKYRSSDGLGLLEFLNWCEDLRMQPVLAVYAGYSLLQEHVAPRAELTPYVQDALDELEYVTGDSGSTKWGAVRARNGHPAPYPLTYVEIGNEDEFDKSKSYDGRFAQFYDAIKAKYPRLQLIATTPVSSRKPDLIDDHYYKRADEFFPFVHHYDKADRNGPKIFVGEWATREGTPTTNLGAALGDAAWMTAMERNSDLIVMASYAPLFVNVNPGGLQWHSDLIGYNALTSYGSPSYWAQVMFSNHLGNEILQADLSGNDPRLFASATRDSKAGTVILKVVNANSDARTISIQMKGGQASRGAGTLVVLQGNSNSETNTIDDPRRIVPEQTALTVTQPSRFEHTFPARSISVIESPVQ